MRDDDFVFLLTLTDDELNKVEKVMNIQEVAERLNRNSLEAAKLQAETARLQAEHAKIQKEMKYYPLLTAGGTAIFLFILNVIAKHLGIL